ncbi:cyclodeaminase/cyclohydrolase family protein [Pseudomonas sp. DC3200b2]|uniref:cyclodeaminase/cyclohydrolase family protein n=1 Tax=Pseudomonas sp. DC3200b2 TaxID=2804669 RepID=UPI003CEF42FF
MSKPASIPSTVWAWPLARFRDALAGQEAVPSCGATAAVGASLALALITMALAKSLERQPSEALARLLEQARSLQPTLDAHADRDMRAFGRFIDDLPHTTPEDALRQADVRRMTEGACHAAADTLRALELARTALPLAAKGLRCDLLAGGLMLHANLRALLLNVTEDLPLLADPAAAAAFEAAARNLGRQAEQALADLMQGPQAASG